MNNEHLYWLQALSLHPANERLRTLLNEAVADKAGHPDDISDVIEELATYCRYGRTQTVKQWLSGTARVPLERLPAICDYFGLPLGLLTPLWLAGEATGALADNLYASVEPKITDDELKLVELARSIFEPDIAELISED